MRCHSMLFYIGLTEHTSRVEIALASLDLVLSIFLCLSLPLFSRFLSFPPSLAMYAWVNAKITPWKCDNARTNGWYPQTGDKRKCSSKRKIKVLESSRFDTARRQL